MAGVVVHQTDNYVLKVERTEQNGLVSVDISSVWPQARTDRSPHKLLNLNLPVESMNKLADALKGK